MMKLARLSHDPTALIDFFQASLEQLGAVCERSWYDRLELVAEGAAAKLFNSEGALCEHELHFPSPEEPAPRDAVKEIFPGCPLTFRLVELLRPVPLALEHGILRTESGKPPATEVAEKLWHAQWPETARWQLATPFVAAHHFSLLAMARCEIQAIDQHWSLHRLALELPSGQRDESMSAALDFAQLDAGTEEAIAWPPIEPAQWHALLQRVMADELADDLAAVRVRQENYLRRELDRVDEYFENYERELAERAGRTASATTKTKMSERLAAASSEHARRRQDQVQRHEIHVHVHLDALLLLAETAWDATIALGQRGGVQAVTARYVPRARRWVRLQ